MLLGELDLAREPPPGLQLVRAWARGLAACTCTRDACWFVNDTALALMSSRRGCSWCGLRSPNMQHEVVVVQWWCCPLQAAQSRFMHPKPHAIAFRPPPPPPPPEGLRGGNQAGAKGGAGSRKDEGPDALTL